MIEQNLAVSTRFYSCSGGGGLGGGQLPYTPRWITVACCLLRLVPQIAFSYRGSNGLGKGPWMVRRKIPAAWEHAGEHCSLIFAVNLRSDLNNA